MGDTATKAEVKVIAIETVNSAMTTLSKQIVAEMTPLCYKIADEISSRALKNFSQLIEQTFHIRIDQPDTIQDLQATLAFARRKREEENTSSRAGIDAFARMKYVVIGGVFTGSIMLLVGFLLR